MSERQPKRVIHKAQDAQTLAARGSRVSSFPITLFFHYGILTPDCRFRHVKLHSSYENADLIYITVHRFWYWRAYSDIPILFGEGTELSGSVMQPQFYITPLEVGHLYRSVTRRDVEIEIRTYVTGDRMPRDRPLDGPLPDSSKFRELPSLRGRRVNLITSDWTPTLTD